MKKGKEKWRPVVGYEGRYDVSNRGRINSLTRNIILKQRVDRAGYLAVTLFNGVKSKSQTVHRLVAIAWIPNPLKKKCVNHKKGIKTRNWANQLEWSTHSENSTHAFAIGIKTWSKEARRKVSKSRGGKQFSAFKDGKMLGTFYSYSHGAKELGLTPIQISNCVRGIFSQTKGYTFIKISK